LRFHAYDSNLVHMKKQPLNRLNHCVYSLQYHLVITTKYRRRCLTEEMRERGKQSLSQPSRSGAAN
jgi:hypothetical protein